MLNAETIDILNLIKEELKSNGNKLSGDFILEYAETCKYEYEKIGDSARVCVMTTTNGSKMVGHALVLDPNNDVESIGNEVAKDECINQLWGFLGGMAKMLKVQ